MARYTDKISVFCAILLPVLVTPATAATVVSSSAYGAKATLNVAGLVGATIGPVASASGTAGAAYDRTATVASVNQNLRLVDTVLLDANQRLSTGVLTSKASSTYPAAPRGEASAQISGLSSTLFLDPLIGPNITLLGLSADTIRSTSTIDATTGLSGFGSTVIEGLNLSGLGLGGLLFDGSLFVNPAANTVLVDLLGLRIVLNEQTRTGDGVTALRQETNAMRLSFNDFALGSNLLTGDIVLGHSEAAITGFVAATPAVPEPASWAMMIGGFGLIGAAMRRRTVATRVAFA